MKKKSNFVLDTKTLSVCAMLTALSIVIGIFCKNFLNFGNGLFRITFENFPILLAGFLYGPITGALVGAASDILSYILSTQSLAISPLITLGAAMVGIVSGFVSNRLRNKNLHLRLALSAGFAHLIGSVVIKSIGLYTFYGAAVLVRIPLYFVICSLETLLLLLMFKNKAICKIFELKRNEK